MLSIKDAALEHAAAIENQLIQIRADQMEQGQQLTERINGVANQVKALDAKVTKLEGRFDVLEQRFDSMEETQKGMLQTQTEMMGILIGIQRKLEAA